MRDAEGGSGETGRWKEGGRCGESGGGKGLLLGDGDAVRDGPRVLMRMNGVVF